MSDYSAPPISIPSPVRPTNVPPADPLYQTKTHSQYIQWAVNRDCERKMRHYNWSSEERGLGWSVKCPLFYINWKDSAQVLLVVCVYPPPPKFVSPVPSFWPVLVFTPYRFRADTAPCTLTCDVYMTRTFVYVAISGRRVFEGKCRKNGQYFSGQGNSWLVSKGAIYRASFSTPKNKADYFCLKALFGQWHWVSNKVGD